MSLKLQQKDIVELSSVTSGTVSKWVSAGLPCVDGEIDSKEFLDWYVAYKGGATEANEARIRKENAQADKTELEVLVMRGELFPTDVANKVWANAVMEFRAFFLQLPITLAEIAVAGNSFEDIEERTRKVIYEAIDTLATSGNLEAKIASAIDDQQLTET